jgi:hypothetical protein
MPTTCCAHSDPVSASCLDTVEMPLEAICDLCERPFDVPWGDAVTAGMCCEKCMEMAAEALRVWFTLHEVAPEAPPGPWELIDEDGADRHGWQTPSHGRP